MSNHLSARRALVVLAVRPGACRGGAERWADGLLGPAALGSPGAAPSLGPCQGRGGHRRFGAVDDRHVRLPRTGVTRAKEPTTKLVRLVGAGVGVKELTVLSTGEVVPSPNHLSRYARRMAQLQAPCPRRAGPAKGRPPSKRWQRSKARLGRAHAKVGAARGDGLHKLSTNLAKRH
ncbi:MAG: transposase [Acidimicrobiales bacterium]